MSEKYIACKKCNVHRIPSGKGSLLEVVEILTLNDEGIKQIPDCYKADLRSALLNVMNWMVMEGGWTKESVLNLINKYKKDVLEANRNTDGEDISDIQIDSAGMLTREVQWADEWNNQQQYDEELEWVVVKSMGKPEARLWWYQNKLFQLNTELELSNKIADVLDRIPDVPNMYKWGKYIKACFCRLDQYYREKKIQYGTWFEFNKQLMEIIGREVNESKYPIVLVPDKIKYYEDKIEELKNEMWENKNMVSGAKLLPEDIESLIEEIEKEDEKLLE